LSPPQLGNIKLKKLGLFSLIYAPCQQLSMLISSGWALKKCSLDCKKVGYDIEGTSLKGNRLINMILLMTLAYSSAIFQGTLTEKKAGTKICISSQRTKEKISQTEYIWCWIRWRKVG
jgi:hypothetical protein